MSWYQTFGVIRRRLAALAHAWPGATSACPGRLLTQCHGDYTDSSRVLHHLLSAIAHGMLDP